MATNHCLFANISYCFDGDMGGSFRYVRETGDAGEKYNFTPMDYKGSRVCWGFFEPGFTKGGYDGGGVQRRLSLEKIDASFSNSMFADGITVIWCAQIKETGSSSIIGWYRDAKVYRNVITCPPEQFYGREIRGFGYIHNVEAQAENCVLLPKYEILSGKWSSPRKKTHGFGFGQSNMWYANEDSAQRYVESVIAAVNHYSGENKICFSLDE